MAEDLIALRELLDEQRMRWLWELEQAENFRLKGEEQLFLRAKAGFRCTQDAIEKVEIMLGNLTGWPNLFPDPSSIALGTPVGGDHV